ncbi:uncharacterized protein LOC133525229 [Cydia pomonella]|uniref:uncharacterized protein LOC133525229 n=1 Tax=Cydia pomonella TaxID=82600 RepID=UPI002ADE6EC9|nr:uncharacterized protein LOC133525229 [Cydia pomonella]
MAADEGICNATCVKKKTKKPCSLIIPTCPMNECVLTRNKHCDYECNGVMCGSECQSEKEKCHLKCVGVGCIARCNGEKCIAVCTGKDCTATCEGEDCIYSV